MTLTPQKSFSKILVDRYDPTMPTVIIDLDDTLGQMHHLLIDHANYTYGLNENSCDWQKSYSFKDLAALCGAGVDEYYERLQKDLVPVLNFKVHANAPEFIQNIRNKFGRELDSEINIHIVTSRGNFWLDHTSDVLDKVKHLDVEGIHVIDKDLCKVTWSKSKYEELVAVFEDSPTAIQECINQNVPVYVSSLDYNKHFDVPRFCLWENDYGCFI